MFAKFLKFVQGAAWVLSIATAVMHALGAALTASPRPWARGA